MRLITLKDYAWFRFRGFVLPKDCTPKRFWNYVRKNVARLHWRCIREVLTGVKWDLGDYDYLLRHLDEKLTERIIHRYVPALFTFEVKVYEIKSGVYLVSIGDWFDVLADRLSDLYVETDGEFTIEDARQLVESDLTAEEIRSALDTSPLKIVVEGNPEFEEYMKVLELAKSEFYQYLDYCYLRKY